MQPFLACIRIYPVFAIWNMYVFENCDLYTVAYCYWFLQFVTTCFYLLIVRNFSRSSGSLCSSFDLDIEQLTVDKRIRICYKVVFVLNCYFTKRPLNAPIIKLYIYMYPQYCYCLRNNNTLQVGHNLLV